MSVFGIINNASANAITPNFALPTVFGTTSLIKKRLAANSNAPPPGTTALSSTAFFTARKPSFTASLIWSIVN